MSKFESSQLNQAFLHQLAKLQMSTDKPRFIVGVSGGPDSMALLYLLHRHNYNPVVVHCNYGLRGKQSDQDQKMVEQICMLWNLECVAVKLEKESYKAGNFQQWARNQRYRVFRELKKEFQAVAILTAHHQDDQIETIFQRILRGSGISKLTGIPAVSGDLIRPLLEVTKSQIIEFVEEMNIPYRIDGSNEESTYARNFLRNRWFPFLEDIFPGWRTNILSLSKRAEVHQHLVEYVASKVQSDPQSFRRSDFNSLNEKLKPVVFKALFDKTLNNQAINKGLLNQIDAIQKLQTGQSIDISDTHKLQRDRDLYVFISKSGNKKSLTDSYFSESELRKGILLKHISIIIQSSSTILDQNRLTLDAENVRFPVTIRKWRTGDKFQPLGMAGTQLVSDHLTNRKISSVRKTEAMVLESFDGMIAAIIFPPDKKRIQAGTISEKVRIGEKTQEIIKIEITQ